MITTSAQFRKEFMVKYDWMHRYGLFTTLSQSWYSSLLFAHQKSGEIQKIILSTRNHKFFYETATLTLIYQYQPRSMHQKNLQKRCLFRLFLHKLIIVYRGSKIFQFRLLSISFHVYVAKNTQLKDQEKLVTAFSFFFGQNQNQNMGDLCNQFTDDLGSESKFLRN